MEFGDKLNKFKVRAKDKVRRVFGSSPSPSIASLPNASPPATSPVPGPFSVPVTSVPATPIPAPRPASTPLTGTPAPVSVPAAPIPAPGPVSTSPTGAPASTSNYRARLAGFRQILIKSSNLVGMLKPVMESLFFCFEIYEDAVKARQDYQALKAELEELFSTLSAHFAGDVPPTMTASMNGLCSSIKKELDQMMIKEERGTGWGYLEAKKDPDEVMECYRRIQGHLERLTLNADLSTWKIVDKMAMDAALEKLKPSMSAYYDSAKASLVGRRECTPETRKEVLAELGDWRHDRERGNIYWLNGMAGTGKTTIATSLCRMLETNQELGASFFCTRQLAECRDVNLILPTIAYQLACFSRPFRCALSRSLAEDPNLHTKALSTQLEGLIIRPLREVIQTLPTDLVVVIDALDEVEDSKGVGQMLVTIITHAANLPIKIFVSSRPEPQIWQRMGGVKSQLVLHELDGKIVKGDIELYLRTELGCMSLSNLQLSTLVKRAGVLFIYAATVVRYILDDDISLDRQERLENVLGASQSSNKHQEIDELYRLILSSVLDHPKLERSSRDKIELILHTVVCTQEPLTTDALTGLLQLKKVDEVHSSLRRLWSVLHVSKTTNLISTLHASFPDYMLDPERSQALGCNAVAHHGRLARLCFARVENNKQLFNICGLESSYVLDDDVPGLEERVARAIPLDLAYACQYWSTHLDMGGWSSKQVQLLDDFLSTRLLLWMEVLNLRKRMNIGPTSLEQAGNWCASHEEASDAKDLIHDAWRFVSTFAANPVSRSTPHIYVSMLASWPGSRPVAKRYIRHTDQLVEVAGTALARRELHLLGVYATGGPLTSAALSPDGMHIVCGSEDKLIRVWDTRTGQMVLGPLEGHTGLVSAVAFSPDGRRIVSGSRNTSDSEEEEPAGRRIRVWDAQSGEMILGPLRGHTRSVLSVAFSTDGMRIASGSDDNTIRVWDAQSGQMAVGPLEGHTCSVLSVAFSSDAMRIVSGSGDRTIRIWDVQSGQMVVGPLQGHPSQVNSVAFSPDGMRIVSGSQDYFWEEEDRGVRVWDAQSGEMMLGPLDGHAGSVLSVAFSPDGTRIVSGSGDATVRVWDAQSGQTVIGPLMGHNGSVLSVAFSPDSMRIISASDDKTIRVWDSRSEQLPLGPLNGHTDSILSVAFSPDSMRIVSGSGDWTIRIWDARSGHMVLAPLEGHAATVRSVAFSSDGMQIVSGSHDHTIRVWDSCSGLTIMGPLEGHTHEVWSVAFSPDGSRIVSCSSDKTIRVWDARIGQVVLGPLEGHTESVSSVTFSPDGTRLVSGSVDETIQVWDAHSGQMMKKLHSKDDYSGACSVKISTDNIHIVSGFADATIWVWDSQCGNVVAGPLTGHSAPIWSVAFSPDGKLIVSGSEDTTIRVWNVKTGQMVVGPLEGHTASVTTVAFSPDGRHIVSGSFDTTIRLWRMPADLIADTQVSKHHSSIPTVTLGEFISRSRDIVPESSASIFSSWELDEAGWVRGEDQSLLLWVPHDLRDRLLMPMNTLMISSRGSVQLTFDCANIGKAWVKCYMPS